MIDSNADDLVAFARQWAPYDGGDEHVYPTFGLSPYDYAHRLHRVIQADDELRDSPEGRKLMLYCSRRIAAYRGRPSRRIRSADR